MKSSVLVFTKEENQMSRRLIVVLAFAFIVGLTVGAYAEVQNVKLSGDLGISAVARNQFDFRRGESGDSVNDAESFFMSQARIRVDADLTDNVGVTLRLINERNWDAESVQSSDIDLDLAFVTLKEFLYSPLSVKLGRQEIRIGNGLIVGSANTYAAATVNGVPTDLSVRKAFDGIRAMLNYDPLMIDVFYVKIDETTSKRNDNTDLYGINASYAFSKKVTGNMYLFKHTDSTTDQSEDIYTIGTLIQAAPVQDLATALEFAYQTGRSASALEKKKRAFAMEAILGYTFSKVKFTPNVTATYLYLSGDSKPGDRVDKSWDSMYYDHFANNIAFAVLPFTNVTVLNLKGSVKPMEDLTLGLSYGYYRFNNKLNGTAMASNKRDGGGNQYVYVMSSGKKGLGTEIDLSAAYDYTEDVQLGLTYGCFMPSSAFAERNRNPANQLIGSMKVTF
jgi:hypothetical protein